MSNIHSDDTIFSVETINGVKKVHILGYGYEADNRNGKTHRFVEYTSLYATLDDVLKKGLAAIENDSGPEVTQYITDCTYEEMMDGYCHYDDGKCPKLISAIDANIADGMYILVKKEV